MADDLNVVMAVRYRHDEVPHCPFSGMSWTEQVETQPGSPEWIYLRKHLECRVCRTEPKIVEWKSTSRQVDVVLP